MSNTLIPSMLDLTDEPNVRQARYEYQRAADLGTDADLLAWARKWGEAALAAADVACREHFDLDGFTCPTVVGDAVELHASLRTELEKPKPGLERLKRLTTKIGEKLEAIVEAYD